MRRLFPIICAGALLAGCGGGGTQLIIKTPTSAGVQAKTPLAGQKLGFPSVATKNTTRVGGSDPVADAAGVALAVYPSDGAGTHPQAVTLAPTDDWEAAIAAASLMAPPIRAPILLSSTGSLPSATDSALSQLAPAGSGAAGGAQVIRIGDVPTPSGMKSVAIKGNDPYSLAAAIDRFGNAARQRTSANVMIASADDPAFAMPAAGYAAESGEPILFVNRKGVPTATKQALIAHGKPHIYVLGPPSVIPDSVLAQLNHYGKVTRMASGKDPSSNSVAFAEYRDPACPYGAPCAHLPGSFGWAMRSPGHGYVLVNAKRTLDAAAAAPLSGSGDYGPQLLIDDPSRLPSSVLNYFLDYATPGYNQSGPTAAVYNHGWVIGDQSAISVGVQAEMDVRLEVVPQNSAAAAQSSGGTSTSPSGTSSTAKG